MRNRYGAFEKYRKMMIYRILILVLFSNTSLFGQTFSKQNLISDLLYLNEAIVNGHPMNYNNDNKIDILPVIETIRLINKDSITFNEYEYWIEKGIYYLGCVHTRILKNPLRKQNYPIGFIPLKAAIQKDKLRITACVDSTKIGEKIESINGISSIDIIDYYKEYKASDGVSNAFSKAYFHLASSRLISEYLQNTSSYKIKTESVEFELKAADKIFTSDLNNELQNAALSNNNNKLYIKDRYAILKLKKFYKSDKLFYSKAFREITDLKLDTVLIDLRQNFGGDRKAAVALTKYLVDSTFSYSLLKPKRTKIYKYLNGKGKFYYFLSFLKYYGVDIYRIRKSKYGNEFRYTYKPKKKMHYEGHVFVLTDGFTCSASTMVTSWLKQHSNAKFLGSQAGGGYNGNNGGSFPTITLPNSKIEIRFPAYRLILDKNSNEKTGIVPDVFIDSFSNYEKIIEFMAK